MANSIFKSERAELGEIPHLGTIYYNLYLKIRFLSRKRIIRSIKGERKLDLAVSMQRSTDEKIWEKENSNPVSVDLLLVELFQVVPRFTQFGMIDVLLDVKKNCADLQLMQSLW